MKINAISFRAYEPYPVGKGNVERRKFEDEQGWNDGSDKKCNNSESELDSYYSRKKAERDFEDWSSIWSAATSAYDD